MFRPALVLIVLVVAACSGGGASTAAPSVAPTIGGLASAAPTVAATSGGTAASPSAPTIATLPPAPSSAGGGSQESLRPTGAQLRIVNLYTGATGQPADVDVYGDFNAKAGPLLKTVKYGTVTDWFDPGALDDQGNASWSFYPAGKTGDDDQLGLQSETLTGKERITLVIAQGENKSANGTQLGRWRAIFETSADFPLPTPPTSASGVLIVDGLGVPALPGTSDTFLYLGADGACLPGVDQGPDGGAQPVGPQSVQNYIWPGGGHTVSFHFADANGQPDCKAKSPYATLTVQVDAGKRAYLFLYSPDGKALKALQVPIA